MFAKEKQIYLLAKNVGVPELTNSFKMFLAVAWLERFSSTRSYRDI